MNCNSNPRELAYKRNYRWSSTMARTGLGRVVLVTCTLLLALSISTSNAFVRASHPAFKRCPTKNRQVGGAGFSLPTTPSYETTSMSVSTIQSNLPTVDANDSRFYKLLQFCTARAPGVALCIALAQISQAMAKTSCGAHVSPLLWATILGMGYGNLVYTPKAKQSLSTGIKFTKARLLRLGIILYGFKITLQQIAGIGLAGLATDVVIVGSTLTMGIVLGTKWLGLSESMSTLIASGAAICGCSAVLATQPVVGKCESHEVSAAVGTVVLGGTLSMFLYPFLFKSLPYLAASPKLMGIYTGSTIHEIAGVVAAGNAMGGDVAFTAVVTKLARVLLLAPALTTLSWIQNRKCVAKSTENGVSPAKCKLAMPWFAFGFVAVSALNSLITFPTALVKLASTTSAFSLLCAMAALGVDSDFEAIRSLGSKPLILAGVLWTWLVVGGLGVARFFVGGGV